MFIIIFKYLSSPPIPLLNFSLAEYEASDDNNAAKFQFSWCHQHSHRRQKSANIFSRSAEKYFRPPVAQDLATQWWSQRNQLAIRAFSEKWMGSDILIMTSKKKTNKSKFLSLVFFTFGCDLLLFRIFILKFYFLIWLINWFSFLCYSFSWWDFLIFSCWVSPCWKLVPMLRFSVVKFLVLRFAIPAAVDWGGTNIQKYHMNYPTCLPHNC